MFTIYTQTNKGPLHIETIDKTENVAFNAARHHAKKHGCVFMVNVVTGKTERINGRGDYLIMNKG